MICFGTSRHARTSTSFGTIRQTCLVLVQGSRFSTQ
jgi:hypothetical protein